MHMQLKYNKALKSIEKEINHRGTWGPVKQKGGHCPAFLSAW